MLGLTFQSWGSEGPFAEVLVVLGVVAKRVLESNLMVAKKLRCINRSEK